jgi:hypothetical protein
MTTHKIERQKRNGIEFIDRGGQLVYDLYMVSPTHELIGEVRTAPDPRIKKMESLFRLLIRSGAWYPTAIELNYPYEDGISGEELKRMVEEALK